MESNMDKHAKLSYGIDEAAQVLGMGRTKLYEEINSGRLRAVKAGKRTLIKQMDLEEWLSSLRNYPVENTGSSK
jgi:excisionase family DNA binding protein